MLTSSILFEALKHEHPNYELHYLINSHTFPVVQNNPFIDKFIFYTPEIECKKFNFYSFLNEIRQEKYDAIIDVYSKTSSNIISLFSRAKIKISKSKWYTSFIYSHTFKEQIKAKTNAGLAIENRLQFLKPLCENIPASIEPKIYLTSKEIEISKLFLIESNLDLSKPLFMISVLGSSENKTYPLEYMAKLLDVIVHETKGQLLFNYIPQQQIQAKEVYDFCKVETKKHISLDVFGKNLREFLAITTHCNALIGNEGGAINMAKALHVPTFTIFSPWILKEAWNMFENGKQHVSVHLKDVRPEFYNGKAVKKMKKDSFLLYKNFSVDTIIPKLKDYLKNL